MEELTQKQIDYLSAKYPWAKPSNYPRLAKYLKLSL